MTRCPTRRNSHVTLRDHDAMAPLFGFGTGEALKDFANRMQAQADDRAIQSSSSWCRPG